MATVRVKGVAARNWFAERLVEEHGEKARDNCCGPMLDAVNAVLEKRRPDAPAAQEQEKPNWCTCPAPLHHSHKRITGEAGMSKCSQCLVLLYGLLFIAVGLGTIKILDSVYKLGQLDAMDQCSAAHPQGEEANK